MSKAKTNDITHELNRYFERLNTPKNWGIEVDEAVHVVLARAEIALGADTICQYVDFVIQELECLSVERMGVNCNFSYQYFRKDDLEKILKLSPYSKRILCPIKNHVDLTNATEIPLKDGTKIPINQHLNK